MATNEKVIDASWADLGYRQITTETVADQASIEFAYDLASNFEFDRIRDSSGCWIRHKARRKGYGYHPSAAVSHIWDSGNFADTVGHDVDDYLNGQYGKYITSTLQTATAEQISTIIDTQWDKEGAAQSYAGVARCLELAKPTYLAELLTQNVLPRFFQLHPKGKVVAILHDYRFIQQLSFLRSLYSLKHFSKSEFDQADVQSFETLNAWQSFDPISFTRACLQLANLAFYPHISGFDCGPYGFTLQFCFSESVEQEPPSFPTDWLDRARSWLRIGRQHRDVDAILKGTRTEEYKNAAHSRHMSASAPSVDEHVEFLSNLVDQSSRVLFELLDPCNFTVGNREIDSVWGFENMLTIDRLLSMCIAAVSADEPILRKTSTFECAELLDTLSRGFANTQETELFKKLLHPTKGLALVTQHLSDIPQPVRGKLQAIAAEIYANLEKEILNSIWFSTKRQGTRILVKDKSLSREREVPNDDFVADLMRDFRNTHHGYLTKLDAQKRPSRRLALTTGNVPDSITHLPVLWWLSFLSSVGGVANWSPQSLGIYDG